MDMLVSTEWLAGELGASDLHVVDATQFLPDAGRDAKAEYGFEHIPGAVFMDLAELRDTSNSLPGMLPPAEKFASRMQSLGIGDGSRIVIYDNSPLHSAARAWWMTKDVFGAHNVAILDGGLAKWKAEGRDVEQGKQQVRHRHFTPFHDDSGVRNVDDVKALVGSDDVEIVDARPASRFAGEDPEPRADIAPGHIPGSKNVPHSNLFNEDGTWKRGADLTAAFEEASVDLEKPMVTTCGGGLTAAVLLFGAKLSGKTDVALYDGSWGRVGQPARHRKSDGSRVTAKKGDHKAATRLVTGGRREEWTGAVVNPPVWHASTILYDDVAALRAGATSNEDGAFFYGRRGTPTQWALAEALTEMEPGAAGTMLFPSGVSAIACALLAVLRPGDVLLCTDSSYDPTRSYADAFLRRWGVETRYYDPLIGAGMADLICDRTAAILMESPGSLTFEVQDVPAICAAAKDRDVVTLLDNTWAASHFFRAIEHGVDINILAATKYIVGQ